MANAGSRAENRTRYTALNDGLDAMRIHDTAARKVVRDFTNEVHTSAEYRAAFQINTPGLPTDFELLLATGALQLWTTPSMQYLALGGRYDTANDDLVDGYMVIAKAYRTHLKVEFIMVFDPVGVIRGRTIPYPNHEVTHRSASPRADRVPVVVCPRCCQALPATRVCDTCT